MRNKSSHVSFLCKFDFSKLFSLCHFVLVLYSHNTTTPVFSEGVVLVELASEVLAKQFQVLEVFLLNFGKGNACGCLLVYQLAESCLSFHESISNTLLSAEGWQEDHHFNGVDIVSNNYELCLLIFNQLSNVVETEFKHNWLGALFGLIFRSSDLGLSFLLESGLLVLLGLWGVLCEELKEGGS